MKNDEATNERFLNILSNIHKEPEEINVNKSFLGAASGVALSILAFSSPAKADPAYLSFGAGYYDVFNSEDSAGDFRLEYRHNDPLLWKIKPWAGIEVTSDASVWAGGGIYADFKPAPKIYISPSFGVGLYAQGSNDKDLGSVVEFRTQLEGGYEFNSGHRLGLAFSHMSNGGLSNDNPGVEAVTLTYSIPLTGLNF